MNQTDDSHDDDDTGWVDAPKQQRKKLSTNRGAATTGTAFSTSSSCNMQAPEWMTKIPCRIQPPTSPTPVGSTACNKQQSHHHDHHGIQQQHILLLVGLPGSGKTTLATTLCRIVPWKYMHVSQDLLKTRPACLRATQRILDAGKCPIIDRCNVSKQQRAYFTNFTTTTTTTNSGTHNNNPTTNASFVPVDCVVLQLVSAQECIARIKHRTGHPTLGKNTSNRCIQGIVSTMQQEWEKPSHRHESATIRTIQTIHNDIELQTYIDNLLNDATVPTAATTTMTDGVDTFTATATTTAAHAGAYSTVEAIIVNDRGDEEVLITATGINTFTITDVDDGNGIDFSQNNHPK